MTETPDVVTGTPAALIEEVLRMVRLSSAVFLRGEFTAPWAFSSLEPRECVDTLCPGADRLILFHVVIEGRCRVWLESGEEVLAGPGEAVVLPYGDRHFMGHPGRAPAAPIRTLLPPAPWSAMPVVRHGGGGDPTRILCGYLNCEDLLFHPLLRALPPLIHVRPASAPASDWLRASALYTLDGAGSRLPELLFVECLRQSMESLPPARAGWLAALRDPVVGRALALLHAAPAESWTVERLARLAAVSRTVLGERFAAVLGEPPMRYLMHWRLQLAAHQLAGTARTLPEIAGSVGYESEAAFSRAFKRGLGVPPAAWRARRTPARSAAPAPSTSR